MKSMKRTSLILVSILTLLLLTIGSAAAQDSQERGSIRGAVYLDVNGDGQCINTGVEGENPVEGIDIEFVSSDEETVVTLYTGSDGTYGLVAAGQSVWRVTAKPDPTHYIVTSENPLYVPVLPEDGLVQTGVNFCVSEGTNAVIILPQSGAAAGVNASWVWLTAVLGLSLVGVGAGLEWKRRQSI